MPNVRNESKFWRGLWQELALRRKISGTRAVWLPADSGQLSTKSKNRSAAGIQSPTPRTENTLYDPATSYEAPQSSSIHCNSEPFDWSWPYFHHVQGIFDDSFGQPGKIECHFGRYCPGSRQVLVGRA